LYETVRELAQSGQVELFFLVYQSGPEPQGLWNKLRSKFKTKGLWRAIELGFFRAMVNAELKSVSILTPKLREHNQTLDIAEFNQNETVRLTPLFSASGLVVRFPAEDIETIRSLRLDLIVRGNAPGIFKGEIIRAARDGIISFHHGDNRSHRGGPAAFWEVYLRKPSTGFILQILSEELDGGTVIFRGNVQTRRSYTENIVNLFEVSFPYLAKIVLQYAASDRLPAPEEGVPYGGGILQSPSLIQSVNYAIRTMWVYAVYILERKAFHRYKRWGVAFLPGSWESANLRKGTQVKNPPGHYFADPFVVTWQGRTVCFVEDFSFDKKRGWITAIELRGANEYEILGTALEEPFHMSYPYIFEYQNELYMIPESRASNSIRLYRCVDFPLRWEFQKEIMRNVYAVDSMLFEREGRWWLLSNIASPGSRDNHSQLMAFHGSDPLTDSWTPHEHNPIVFDSETGRNGGLVKMDGSLVRGRQRQGFDAYGAGLSVARLVDLTPTSFREEEIGRITPDFFPNLQGCHHVNSNGAYTVYDYVRLESAGR
jgi:hypothetical protein